MLHGSLEGIVFGGIEWDVVVVTLEGFIMVVVGVLIVVVVMVVLTGFSTPRSRLILEPFSLGLTQPDVTTRAIIKRHITCARFI